MWPVGTLVVQENYYAGHLITVYPVTVVADEPDRLVLYTAAGSTTVDGTMANRPSIPLEDRMKVYADPSPQPFRDKPARANVLTINTPGAFHSVWLFWSADWQFLRWYVNLQWPYRRTPFGIAHGPEHHGDLLLDIVVNPDFSWAWKDEDEFEAACELGLLTSEERQLARDEAARVIDALERRLSPFDEPWADWRPDPEWTVPHLRTTGPRTWEFAI